MNVEDALQSRTDLTTPNLGAAPRLGPDFVAELLTLIPQLRAYTGALSRHREDAEDLAQETLAKALRRQGDFQTGTNLRAWLFAVARNEHYSRYRRARREKSIGGCAAEAAAISPADQIWPTELADTLRELRSLPDNARGALLLIAANGWSYHEVAAISGSPVGTIRSRVCRARRALLAYQDKAPGVPKAAAAGRPDKRSEPPPAQRPQGKLNWRETMQENWIRAVSAD